jgi:hypothetical protein
VQEVPPLSSARDFTAYSFLQVPARLQFRGLNTSNWDAPGETHTFYFSVVRNPSGPGQLSNDSEFAGMETDGRPRGHLTAPRSFSRQPTMTYM